MIRASLSKSSNPSFCELKKAEHLQGMTSTKHTMNDFINKAHSSLTELFYNSVLANVVTQIDLWIRTHSLRDFEAPRPHSLMIDKLLNGILFSLSILKDETESRQRWVLSPLNKIQVTPTEHDITEDGTHFLSGPSE